MTTGADTTGKQKIVARKLRTFLHIISPFLSLEKDELFHTLLASVFRGKQNSIIYPYAYTLFGISFLQLAFVPSSVYPRCWMEFTQELL